MIEVIQEFLNEHLGELYIPDVKVTDVFEIAIIAFAVYHIFVWIKNTKAWMLLKGIAILGIFILIAAIFRMNTILWIVRNSITVLATAAVIVFQPELRRALEKLGQGSFLSSVLPFDRKKDAESANAKYAREISSACFKMGEAKTGALIVVEREIVLTEYRNTGIALDCLVSEQVLINIFEHNTPLHDGAAIIRDGRIAAATCYLPLTEDTGLSKQLGTRHRAAVGMSEVSDALVICVSEETGHVSYATGGHLYECKTQEELTETLTRVRVKSEERPKKTKSKKGSRGDEENVKE